MTPSAQQMPVADIPIDRLVPSATNPRKRFDDETLAELTESVRRHGVFQPILVRPLVDSENFEIVAGERRFRAATAAGLDRIPAIVRALQDQETLELQILENLQRQDLHPLEEAEGYEELIRRGFHTVESLADRVGKSKAYVYTRLALTKLTPAARKAFYAGHFSASTALLIARIPGPKLQDQALKEIETYRRAEDGPVSHRTALDVVHRRFMLRLVEAPFRKDDADLLPAAGACVHCPKRTGNTPELFPDVERADTCSDPDCFEAKTQAHTARVVAEAKAKGLEVIQGAAAKKAKPHSYGTPKGLVPLDRQTAEVPGNRTYRKLLGKDFQATVFVDPHTGIATEMAPVSAIKAALEKAGIADPRRMVAESERKRDRQHKIETEFRWSLARALREPREMTVEDSRLVAVEMLDLMNSDALRRLFKLRGWVGADGEAPSRRDGFRDLVDPLQPGEIPQLMIDAVLASELFASPYGSGKPLKMLALADRLGIDPAPIRREATARVKAGEKPAAKKPAAKKASKGKARKKPGDAAEVDQAADESTAEDGPQ